MKATCVLIDDELMGLAAAQLARLRRCPAFISFRERLAFTERGCKVFKFKKAEIWLEHTRTFECVDDWGPSYYLHCGFVCAHLGERLVFNEANMISSRSVLHVCSRTSVGRVSPTKTHSMPPTPPENSPSPLSCAFRSGSLFVFGFFCAFRVSGSTTAQLRSPKNPADQKLLEHQQRVDTMCLIILKGNLIESRLTLGAFNGS